MAGRELRVTVRLCAAEVERLDGLARQRGGSRAAALRALLRDDAPVVAPATADEAVALLAASARDCSVTARVALVGLLSKPAVAVDQVQAEIDELARRRVAKEERP